MIFLLLLELGSDEVHFEDLLLPLGWVRAEVFLACHGLAQARGNNVQDDIDPVVVSHLCIDIDSINIS